MGLSFVAMFAAALGGLVPVVGAVVQEAIDVAVILNALRAHGGPREPHPPEAALEAGRRVLDAHAAIRRGTADLRRIADELGRVPPALARAHLEAGRRFLVDELLPHEADEERTLYPAVGPYIGGEEAVVAARREHAEVAHLVRVLNGMIETLEPGGPTDDEVIGLRRVLYSLHAVLSLHRSGEEERLSRVVGAREDAPIRMAG